jgi:hypothetical protein
MSEVFLQSQEMLGAVPSPDDDARCDAISKRSGKRCMRHAQAGSSVCSKHGQALHRSPRRSGSGSLEPSWAAQEDLGARHERWAAVNAWLEATEQDELSELVFALCDKTYDLTPETIRVVAVWLEDVLEGLAITFEEEAAATVGA